MKSKLLGCALIGFTIVVAACAADDDTPAAAVTPSPDIAEGDADAAQGDAVAPESDTTSDTASETRRFIPPEYLATLSLSRS